jgi:MFS family permease
MSINSSRFRSSGPLLAVTTLFLMIGLLAGTWFSRIPAVTSNLDLDVGQIGLLLLFFSLGALVVFQVIGRVIARYGSHRVAHVAGFGFAAAIALVALAPTAASFALALFLAGLAFGGLNVALNAQGVTIERHLGRPVMNMLHGWFTTGMMVGSLLGGGAVAIGLGPVPHFAGMTGVALAIVVVAGPRLLPDAPAAPAESARRQSRLLPRTLWPLAILAFCASVTEGAMYDWSALYIHEDLGASEGTGAIAFAVFSLAVLIGRFGGDRAVVRLGSVGVVRMGSALAGAGVLAGLAVGTVPAGMVGFAALGLGVSVLTPLFYSIAGSRPDVPSAQGVAAVATCGMLGLLAGPPLLGNLADVTSLRFALAVVAVPCTVMFVMAVHARSAFREADMAAVAEGAIA